MSLRSMCAATALLILVGCSNKRDLGNVPDGGGGSSGQGGQGGQGDQSGQGGTGVPCDGGVVFVCIGGTPVCNPSDCPSTGTAGTGGGAGVGGAAGTGGVAGTGGSSGAGGATGGSGGSAGTGGSSGAAGRGGNGGSGGSGGTSGGGTGGSGGSAGTGGGTATSVSCLGLAPICGPNRDQDCCASALVPGGTFNRSNDSNYPATISTFKLDVYTVTVNRFRQFINAYYIGNWRPSVGQGKNPNNAADTGWQSAWDANLTSDISGGLSSQFVCDGKFPTWTSTPGANENKPMTCPSWYEAFAFCAWDGGRLVTEAEYNFASAGGTEQRYYPWSIPPSDTTIDSSYLSYNCMSDGSAAGNCTASDVMVVGSKPKGNGRWGHADLAGNILQWTRDWNGTYQLPCNDCAQTTTTDMWRLLRGGSYSYAASYQTTAFRYGFYSGYFRSSEIGFRCARNESAGTITEYPVPTASSEPLTIVAGPDGNLWFTEYSAGKIGRITPAGTITEFPTGVSNEVPGITVGPDNSLWFTEAGADKIGRITTAGTVTEFPLPATGRFPNEITKGPDGNLWFTEQHGNRIGRITPGGVVTEFPTPTATSEPGGIAAGPDGNLWFAEHTGNKIGRITPAGTITEFLAPGNPTGIVAGADGNLWFTEEVGAKIGRITTSGSVVEFPIPTSQPSPEGITSGPDGNLWFTEAGSNKIGRVTPAGTFKEYVVPSAGAYPLHITVGPDGVLWFTEEFGNRIGRLVP